MSSAKSPAAVGIVLGLVVGAAGAAAIAVTSSNEGAGSGSPPKVAIAPRVAVSPSLPPDSGPPPTAPSGLPQLTGDAKGYRLGTQPAPGAVERLAAAFDMHAAVESDAGGWVVRDGNRLVRVQRAAGLPWFFTTLDGPCKLVPENPKPPPEALPPVAPPGPTDCPDIASPTAAPAAFPPQDEALSFGMETLGRAGLGVSRPVIVDQPGGWYIEASPLVDDKPTSGLPWTVSIGPGQTVTAASGFLAAPERADTYRLVGVARGLQRARQVSPDGTITGVRLGLMLGHVGSAPYLVPAYLFELGGGPGGPPPIVPVPAIEDRYLS